MEREWRDALLITEPSACSWTTSNSTGSWVEERERDGGWDPMRERENVRENTAGRGWWRGKGGKMKALMIYEMGREKGCWVGTGEGNLNDLNKAWYGQGSVKETGDLKWSRLIQGKTRRRWLHLTIGFELFFHREQCHVNPDALAGNRELHND